VEYLKIFVLLTEIGWIIAATGALVRGKPDYAAACALFAIYVDMNS
jgi:hypothetical protein